eukprot:UN07951
MKLKYKLIIYEQHQVVHIVLLCKQFTPAMILLKVFINIKKLICPSLVVILLGN